MKKFVLLSIIVVSTFLFMPFLNAEDFTTASRFHYWVYENNTIELFTGDGLYYGTFNNVNRLQWLYNTYTYDTNYIYDISFTVENYNFPYYGLDAHAESCEIYTGSGEHYTCSVSKEYRGTSQFVTMSVYNMRGTGQSTTWLNFYSAALRYDSNILSYRLSINRKEDPYATSQNIQQQTQQIINNQNTNTQNIINSQNDINNSINDDSSLSNSEISDYIEDFNDYLPNNQPITNLILLPITFLQSIVNNIGNTCVPYSFGSLYNTEIRLPCIDLSERLGTTLWNNIDVLTSIFMIYNLAMLFVTIFTDITSLNDSFLQLYEPRHAYSGYHPRHAAGGDS